MSGNGVKSFFEMGLDSKAAHGSLLPGLLSVRSALGDNHREFPPAALRYDNFSDKFVLESVRKVK